MKKKIKYMGLLSLLLVSFTVSCSRKNKDIDTSTSKEEIVTITPTLIPNQNLEDSDDDDKGIENNNEDNVISEDEATKLILERITDRGYYVNFVEEREVKDHVYYVFQILNGDEIIGPEVIVGKTIDELGVLTSDNRVTAIEEHPIIGNGIIDSISNQSSESTSKNWISKEQVIAILTRISKEKLDLPVELSEYIIMFDDITTIVYGKECFGVLAYADLGERMELMGTYYVAVDGSATYRFDSILDDFILLK